MKNSIQARLRRGIFIASIVVLALGPAGTVSARNEISNSARSKPNVDSRTDLTVLLEEPSIFPSYSEVCASGWHRLENVLDSHPGYLSLNVSQSTTPDHTGEWRPNLPQAGIFRVEAYVPAHPSIYWPCSIQRTIGWDTSAARYQVNHASGQAIINVNQAPLNDEWYPLGEFFFNAGTSGSVVLTNQTGEADHNKTVSFSGMRFTWLRGSQEAVYIPFLKGSDLAVDLKQVWTADSGGQTRQVFPPSQPLQFHGSGTISTPTAIQANLTIIQQGLCDNQTVFNGPVNLQDQSWTFSYASSSPDCTGFFTYTFRLTYQNRTSEIQSSFIVSTFEQAFDKCNIPTLTQMQTWWNSSPYDAINLYIGGISRATACSNPGLNASWVQSASQQGWTFIPTWVGPQAPCSKYAHKMSSDATTAYQQGRGEADDAVEAGNALGLLGDQVIYYDIESYSGATNACRNTVKSFVKGWVERLHELGAQAGVYGTPYTSYISDWATVNPMPDDVWIASWIRQNYDPYATVWNINGLDNSLWPNHQRLRQYAGDHTETWGGVGFTIDSNAVDGAVSSFQSPTTSAPGGSPGLPLVDAVQLIDPRNGWALAGDRLLWTGDGGGSWKEITPAMDDLLIQPLRADFLDQDTGWLLARTVSDGLFILFTTNDGGNDWQRIELNTHLGSIVEPDLQPAAIDFVDANTGWILFQVPSSSNFSLGRLYHTQDGGQTWVEVNAPAAGKIKFVTNKRGWLAGGPGSSELYRTDDGGYTWQLEKLESDEGKVPGEVWPGLPRFSDDTNGVIVIAVAGEQPEVEIYSSSDQGSTWNLTASLALELASSPAGPLAFDAAESDWFIALPGTGELYQGNQTASQTIAPFDLSGNMIALEFANTYNGWGIIQTGNCSGSKIRLANDNPATHDQLTCQHTTRLVKTVDGGVTWIEITPELN